MSIASRKGKQVVYNQGTSSKKVGLLTAPTACLVPAAIGNVTG